MPAQDSIPAIPAPPQQTEQPLTLQFNGQEFTVADKTAIAFIRNLAQRLDRVEDDYAALKKAVKYGG